MDAIRIQNLTKKYRTKTVLKNINLTIPSGQTVALLGSNGSGKTTFFKLLVGLQRPNQGVIQLSKIIPSSLDISAEILSKQNLSKHYLLKEISAQNVAYLPDESFLPLRMNVKEMVNYYGSFYTDFDQKKMQNLLSFMELNSSDKISELSNGMRRRLELALIFARNASLILLDEPFNIIDLLSREKIIQAIIQEHRFGETTLIISTHLIDEIEHLVERVIILKNGVIAADIDLEEWKLKHNLSLKEMYCEVIQS